ncbi:MAG: tetratricopeptide repeat protein [Spirochaetota bacterium]
MGKNKRLILKIIQIKLILIFLFFLLFFPISNTKADFQASKSITLFINSYPYKANIYIDKKYVGQTPFIIRDLTAKTIKIKIVKDKFLTFEKSFTINEDKKFDSIFVWLQPQNFSLSILDTYSIKLNKEIYDSPVEIDNIPNGSYQIYKKGNTIYFIHDNVKFYISILSYILTLGSAGYGALNGSTELLIVSAVSFIISIYFLFTTYLPSKDQYLINKNPLIKEDENIFTQAQSYLNKSQFNQAIGLLQQILTKYPESYYVPHSIYYIAYCYDALGDFAKSKNYYEQLIQNYPIIDFYDVSFYSLGKIYYDAGLYEKSIQFFTNILFIQPDIISEDYVDSYILLNYIKIFLTTGKDNKDEITYYFQKVLKERIGILRGEVYYNMALYYLKNGKKAEAIELLEKIIKDNLLFTEEATNLLSQLSD